MVSRDLFRSLLKQQGCSKGKESKKARQAKSHPRHSHLDSIYRFQRLLELDEIYVGDNLLVAFQSILLNKIKE